MKKNLSIKEIEETEVSEQFIQGMKDRMVVSFHKYGYVEEAVGKVDFVKSLERRLKNYAEDGNTEWLIDAANYAMMEFMFPSHKKAHFTPTDSQASPGRWVIDEEDEEGGLFYGGQNKYL